MRLARVRSRCVVLATVLGLAGAGSAPAQEAPAPVAPNYGTSALTYEQIPGSAFFPLVSSTTYSLTAVTPGQALRIAFADGQYFSAPVSVPSGALLKSLDLHACDNAGPELVQGTIIQSDAFGNVTASAPFLKSDGTGCKTFTADLTSLGMVSDNHAKHIWLVAYLNAVPATKTVGLAGMTVGYQLQVSPAPGTATFGDVPTNNPFFQYVEALAASGITGGCGGGNYCPNNPVTRGQMAVFLAKALGLQFQ